MTHFDQKTLLPALLQIEDPVSMPPLMKFKGGRPKNILNGVTEGLVPSVVLNRKDKMGFPVPLDEWMRGGVVQDSVSDVLLSEKSRYRGIFTPDALREMLENRRVGALPLWGALSLQSWHQTFIDVD